MTMIDQEDMYKILFEASPAALCIFDASELAAFIKSSRDLAFQDIGPYFDQHPEELYNCLSKIRIDDVNQAAVDLVGADSKESIIQNPAQLLPLGGEKLLIDFITLVWRGELTSSGHFTGHKIDGRKTTSKFRWTVVPNREENYAQVILSLTETTSQSIVKEELHLVVEQLRIIHDIESGILAAKSPQDIAQFALGHIESIIPSLSLTVSLFDTNTNESVLLAGLHTVRKPGKQTPITPSPMWDQLKQGRTVVLNDLSVLIEDSEDLQAAYENGGHALMIVPLIVQGRTIGAINLLSAKVNAFSKNDEEVVRQIGGAVAIAIHNKRLLETEQEARREADILREVAADINASLDKEELLDLILRQLQRVLPYDSASILQYKDDKLIIAAQNGLTEAGREMLSPLDPIPANIARLTDEQKPLIIRDTHQDPNWKIFPEVENIRCWLGVPLITKDSFIGLLMIDKWEPFSYSEHSANLALAFANHAAITIENARLYHETQLYGEQMERRVKLQTRDLSALYDITAATSQYLDLPTILEEVMSKIAATMDCSTVTVHMLDQSGEMLRLIGHHGLGPAVALCLQELPVEHESVGQVLQTGEPSLLSNVRSRPALSKIPIPAKVTHSAAAPIRAKGTVVGLLGIAGTKSQPFTREDIALLSSIADHIGIAIENDRLQKQAAQIVVIEERERLARDLHDSVTQSLFSLTLFAATARELVHNDQLLQAEQFIDDIASTANQTHKEMRLLLYELQPSVLAREGLVDALRQRLDAVESRSGIDGQLSADLNTNLPTSIEAVLFKVANEALNNTLKHANADKVLIKIEAQETQTRMEITDNGTGFQIDSKEHKMGMGLTNMKQRMMSIGGTFDCRSSLGEGTTITVSVEMSDQTS